MDTSHEWKILTKKKSPYIEWLQIFATFVAVIFSIIIVSIGIGWLASVVIVLVSGKLLGFTIFFGIPPIILSILITAGAYIAYWPVALITKGLWSLAKMKNNYKVHEIMTGAIIFALAIATVIIIAVNLGRNINFEYKDKGTQIILDEGNICVSEESYCIKY